MVINVESTIDNIVSFRPIGCTLRDFKLNYAETCPASTGLTNNSLSLDRVDILIPTQLPTKHPKHPSPDPLATPPKVDCVYPSDITKMHLKDMIDIRPCGIASISDTRRAFDLLKIQHIFGCRHLRNPNNINSSSDNTTLIDTGEPPTTLGAFASIPKAN